MSKLDVGVGEEFPVDEGTAAQESGACGTGCGPGDRSEAYRQWREQKRQWRQQMRAEWRTRKHAMRERFRGEFSGADASEGPHLSAHHMRHLAIGALALIGWRLFWAAVITTIKQGYRPCMNIITAGFAA